MSNEESAEKASTPSERADASPGDDRPPDGDAGRDGAGEVPSATETPAGGERGTAAQETAGHIEKAVYITFNGDTDMRESVLGMAQAEPGDRGRAISGTISTAVIKEAVSGYASPGDCFDEARAALANDNVVVLTGRRGRGKRTGALVMLHEVIGPDAAIVALPPSISLRELAARKYSKGYGYVVLDRVDADPHRTGRGRPAGSDVDHAWLSVLDRVGQFGAHLVVSVIDEPARTPDSVRHVRWEAPPVRTVLRARLGDDTGDEVIDAVEEALPDEFAMRDLHLVAEQLAAGRAPDEAVADVLDEAGRQEVRAWFEEKPDQDQVLAVTVLAFLARIPERRFEACVELLTDVLEPARAESAPEPDAGRAPAVDDRPVIAQGRRRDERLIRVVQVQDGASTRRALALREDSYRPYVLEELVRLYPMRFWDAVRGWLDRLVLVPDDELRLGIGSALALLAYFDRDETEAYLDAWSRAEAGWQGQATAVYVLWFLCLDEAMVPIAQRIADHWAGQGTAAQRRTAIQAFAGELGVRLPQLGARRLWQLVRQENQHSEPAAAAFGELFAALVARDGDAGQLVGHLRAQLREYGPVGPARNRYRLTLVGVLSVVRARSARTGVPAVVEYLRGRPERLPGVAELWATAIRHRPCRRPALEALLTAFGAMARQGGADAEREVRALAEALTAALPPAEFDPLKADFGVLLAHARPNGARDLGEIMLAALDRAAAVLKRRPR